MAQIDDFIKYLHDIKRNESVKSEGYHLGYLDENVKASMAIPKDRIVVDVGCGFGWQQILFKDHKKYIGIQWFVEKRRFEGNANLGVNKSFKIPVLTDNATFIQKNFSDVDPSEFGWTEETKNDFYGLAIFSLYLSPTYQGEIKKFENLFIHNYHIG